MNPQDTGQSPGLDFGRRLGARRRSERPSATLLLIALALFPSCGVDSAGPQLPGGPDLEAQVDSVRVSPSFSTLVAGAHQRFTATVHGTGDVDQRVMWTATAGSIDSTGLYTAPDTLPAPPTLRVTVTARSVADTTKVGAAEAIVQVVVYSVKVSPETATLAFGEALQFTAEVHGAGNFNPGLTWTAAAGRIDSTGLYVAPDSPVVDTIWAISVAAPTKSASGLTTVIPGWIAFWTTLPMREDPACGACEDIYVMHADGSNVRRLTTNPAQDFQPAWSPDGSRVAFVSHRTATEGGTGIYVINADGSGEARLLGGMHPQWPNWSPDGSKIAFMYIDLKPNPEDDRNGIAVTNADGTIVVRLTSDPCPRCFASGHPSWSPDGSKIVFDAYRNGADGIWVMNADGSGQALLHAGGTEPAWSPDGSRVAFVSGADIYLMDYDGGGVMNLTDNPLFESDPHWSPDGTRIVFAGTAPNTGGFQIYVIRSDGTDRITLPTLEAARYPAWRPRRTSP